MTEDVVGIIAWIVQGFVAMVALGAVPWAMKVTRELGEIRTALRAVMKDQPEQQKEIDNLKRADAAFDVRLARMGNGQ